MSRWARLMLVVVAAGLVLCAPRTARADEELEAGEVATYAVEKRLFKTGLELGAGLGFLPMNAFSKGLMVEGQVTWHWSTAWAWEIVQGGYVFANFDTKLKKELLDNFGVEPTQLSRADYLLSSNIIFKPYYGKIAGLNRNVNHIEIYFPAGIALAHYQNPGAFQQGPDFGAGLRWFLGTHTSLRLDARDILLFQSFKNFSLTNEVMLALGVSVAWGGADR